MSLTGALEQFFELVVAVAAAPLFLGWVNQCRALFQNRSAPPLLQPYRSIRKLFHKDAVLATSATPVFRSTPYVIFATMAVAAAIIPSLSVELPFGVAADAIALVGLFAMARMFIALAAMDIGTAFGTLGARREMLVGFLAEPALLMVFLTTSLIAGSTALPAMVDALASQQLAIYPSLAFAGIAFIMVLLAENARIPIDNPATHLELTMIHEAMVLEYSARHLALIEWAVALKLMNYACIGFALFVPWGIAARGTSSAALLPALAILVVKLTAAGAGLALIETLSAKLRIFRAPEFLTTAFLLAVLGMLIRLLLGKLNPVTTLSLSSQLLNLLAAFLLLLSFAMLSQRRMDSLINLLAMQGFALCVSTAIVASQTGHPHLYYSAVLTLVLKVALLPWILHRVIRRLNVQWDTEPLVNIPGTMLIALALVVFAFGLTQPIVALASTVTRDTLGIALAVVLLAFLMMITRRKAIAQVIGFLAMENGLFCAAASTTYGMPMIVELGIALDVLVGVLIVGVFLFRIREQFDSLDLHHLESLKER